MKILFTFPGQGSQKPNMLHRLPDTAITKHYLTLAQNVLKEDVFKLDTIEALQKTRSVQLCIFVTGVIYAKLLEEQGIKVDISSGFSIGAFAAAVFAGALDFVDALHLVSLRGTLMGQAYPQGYGLTCIQGLYYQQLETLVAKVRQMHLPVYIANLNDEDQFVIAGSDAAMQQVVKIAKENGARKTMRLAVSVPSHCELLLHTAQQFIQAVRKVTFKIPNLRYLSGNTARILVQPEKIADDLAYNMVRQVRWHEAMRAAYERGIRLAIEMPPGAVLTGLMHKIMIDGEAVSVCQNGLQPVAMLVKDRIDRSDD